MIAQATTWSLAAAFSTIFCVGKFLYDPKQSSGNGPDQDREHDKPNAIWDRSAQGVFRIRVIVHTEVISTGRTTEITRMRPCDSPS
jgi:hypothetical protein